MIRAFLGKPRYRRLRQGQRLVRRIQRRPLSISRAFVRVRRASSSWTATPCALAGLNYFSAKKWISARPILFFQAGKKFPESILPLLRDTRRNGIRFHGRLQDRNAEQGQVPDHLHATTIVAFVASLNSESRALFRPLDRPGRPIRRLLLSIAERSPASAPGWDRRP